MGIWVFLYKTELKSDPETFPFDSLLLFHLAQTGSPEGSLKSHKSGVFAGSLNKIWIFGVLY